SRVFYGLFATTANRGQRQRHVFAARAAAIALLALVRALHERAAAAAALLCGVVGGTDARLHRCVRGGRLCDWLCLSREVFAITGSATMVLVRPLVSDAFGIRGQLSVLCCMC